MKRAHFDRSPDAPGLEEPDAVREFFAGIATVPQLIDKRSALSPERAAHVIQDAEGNWHAVSWAELKSRTHAIARFYDELGLKHGDRIAILAATSHEWELCQIGAMRHGMAVIGIDPYYPAEQINEILAELKPAGLVVGDEALWSQVSVEVRSALRAAIIIRASGADLPAGVVPLPDPSHSIAPAPELEAPRPVRPEDAAIVVFSSGTTGTPKAIAYTHEQVCIACRSILSAYDDLEEGCNLICWMPLANLFQRIINFCAMAKGAATYVVNDPRQVMDAMPKANPRIFVTVPRFCERLYHGIQDNLAKMPQPLHKLLSAALECNTREFRQRRAGQAVSTSTRVMAALARATIVKRLRALLGSNIKYLVSGSAPCPMWLIEFYGALGIPILEAYGQSEDIVPIAANTLSHNRPGTVGRPLLYNEVRVSTEGVIEVKGPGVFHRDLPENRARPPLTADGYLMTGDLGEIEAGGFIRLTGRASEVVKAPNGRWISPQVVEDALRRVPYVEQAALISSAGLMMAVVSISVTTCPHLRFSRPSEETASLSSAQAQEAMQADFLAVLDPLPAILRPRALLLTGDRFSVESGALTTNFKLRRAHIARGYRPAIDELAREISAAGQAPSEDDRLLLKAV